MKYLISVFIFGISYLPFLVISFVVLNEKYFIPVNIFALIIWSLVYIYIDRFLLVFLRAREVIDTDEQEFFQIVKNHLYKFGEKPPKVYLYQGNYKNCFLFESRKNWIIVLDRDLLKSLNSQSMIGLIDFLFKYKQKKRSLINTKLLGVCSFVYLTCMYLAKLLLSVYNLFVYSFLFILKLFGSTRFEYLKSNFAFKIFSVSSLFFLKPFIIPYEYVLTQKRTIEADEALKQYCEVSKNKNTFENFLKSQVVDNQTSSHVLVEYLENFPILSECEFE